MINEKNHNQKQWIPIFGIYQIYQDGHDGKYDIYNDEKNHPIKYISSVAYHSMITTTGIIAGIECLAKLLE